MRAVITVTALLAAAACARDVETKLDEPIDMGPFTFAVVRAYDEPGTPCRRVVVDLELRQWRDAKVHFDDFLNDSTTEKMFLNPAIALVDSQGHRLHGWVSRVDGRAHWSAGFDLFYDNPFRDERADRCGVSQHKGDFRLTIKNPDRREGQPASVSLPL